MGKVTNIRQNQSKSDLEIKAITMRAEGYSYDDIAKKTGKSKKTVIDWCKKFNTQIVGLKEERFETLYKSYRMTKEHRLKKHSKLLKQIEKAEKKINWETIPPGKLVELHIKILDQINKEFGKEPIGSYRTKITSNLTSEDIFKELTRVLNAFRSGLIDKETAQQETSILENMLKAKEQTEIQGQIETLTNLLEAKNKK